MGRFHQTSLDRTPRSETPVKQLPVVQIDGGEYISQSTAISRYAAKLAVRSRDPID